MEVPNYPLYCYWGGEIIHKDSDVTYRGGTQIFVFVNPGMTYSHVRNKLYEELSIDPRFVELKVVMRYPMAGAYVAVPLNDDNALRAMWISVTQSSSIAMQLSPTSSPNVGTSTSTQPQAILDSLDPNNVDVFGDVEMNDTDEDDDDDEDEFEVGQQFDSLQQLKDAVKFYSIARNKTIRVVEAELEKYVVECKRKEQCSCSWRLKGVKDPTLSTFKIVRYNGPHASYCVGDIDSVDHKLLTSEFVCNALLDVLRVDPSLKIKTMMQLVKEKFEFSITHKRAWLAKQKAIKLIYGDWEGSFQQLPKYMQALRESNARTVVEWRLLESTVPGTYVFQRVFGHSSHVLMDSVIVDPLSPLMELIYMENTKELYLLLWEPMLIFNFSPSHLRLLKEKTMIVGLGSWLVLELE
ncbi:uncharacterized protein LOC110734160 [Chenopodium quinoa]|uniref:uncharacterized protein LOC110734160 n=1 Tax=Chenopodium quinoa TaxID=63459 RepID=UPI000B78978F|nr:uncharacterized protein LOC110734160 [Chenopodium quinoa]